MSAALAGIVVPAGLIELGGDLRAVVITLTVVSVGGALGFWLGRGVRRKRGDDSSSGASIISAVVGLLAFMLAFTFGMAASRHAERIQLVLDDANAIGTADLRSELLPAEQAAEAHALLTEYVDLRLDAVLHQERMAEILPRVAELQARLWRIGSGAVLAQPTSQGHSLFLAALNEMFDIHTSRVAIGRHLRIPVTIWFALYLLAGLAVLAVGYEAGLGRIPHVVPFTVLVLAFTTVMVLIADLDQPASGFLTVSQLPLQELQSTMHASVR